MLESNRQIANQVLNHLEHHFFEPCLRECAYEDLGVDASEASIGETQTYAFIVQLGLRPAVNPQSAVTRANLRTLCEQVFPAADGEVRVCALGRGLVIKTSGEFGHILAVLPEGDEPGCFSGLPIVHQFADFLDGKAVN